jgi:hypothetical protein
MDADSRAEASVPGWAQRLVVANRAGWRWMVLAALGVAVAVAIYDVVTDWEVPFSPLAGVVAVVLIVFVLATCIAVLVLSGYERRTLASGGDSLKVVGAAARGVRWSSLFAIGISVVLFANCSAGMSSGDTAHGANANPSQFWSLAALVVLPLLPLLLAIVLPAGLATAAHVLAGKGRLHEARRIASLGLWSAGVVGVVAVVTTGVALFGGVSECFYVSTASACAAGVGGLMNPTAIASLIVIVPYLVLVKRALSVASSGSDG